MSGFYSISAEARFGTNVRGENDITIATPAGTVQASLEDATAFAGCLLESIEQAGGSLAAVRVAGAWVSGAKV